MPRCRACSCREDTLRREPLLIFNLNQMQRVRMLKKSFFLLFTLWTPILLRAADISTPGTGEKQATPMAAPVSQTEAATPVSQTLSAAPLASVSSKVFSDHLNPIDHAGVWTKFDFSYDYAVQTDLINSAAAINNQSYVNPAGVSFTGYTGSATASHNGLGLGFELG